MAIELATCFSQQCGQSKLTKLGWCECIIANLRVSPLLVGHDHEAYALSPEHSSLGLLSHTVTFQLLCRGNPLHVIEDIPIWLKVLR